MRRLLLLFAFLLVTSSAWSADVSLAWDHSTSTNVTGYKVYLGNSSRTYGTPIIISYQNTYTVTGLGIGTWFFAVTAFDADGNESDFSNEVSQVIGTNRCDLNGDGKIDALDIRVLINGLLNSAGTDLNRDSKVDVLDLRLLSNVVTQTTTCPE